MKALLLVFFFVALSFSFYRDAVLATQFVSISSCMFCVLQHMSLRINVYWYGSTSDNKAFTQHTPIIYELLYILPFCHISTALISCINKATINGRNSFACLHLMLFNRMNRLLKWTKNDQRNETNCAYSKKLLNFCVATMNKMAHGKIDCAIAARKLCIVFMNWFKKFQTIQTFNPLIFFSFFVISKDTTNLTRFKALLTFDWYADTQRVCLLN